MEIRELTAVEVVYECGIATLNAIGLTYNALKNMRERNNQDYFNFVAAIDIIRSCCHTMNNMRLSSEEFDGYKYIDYQVEAMKKGFLASKILAAEKLDEEEQKELDEMIGAIKNSDEINERLKVIDVLFAKKTKDPIRLSGLRPSPLFEVGTLKGWAKYA
jgi:hypothetical protein